MSVPHLNGKRAAALKAVCPSFSFSRVLSLAIPSQDSRMIYHAIKGFGMLPNKRECGFGYPQALLAMSPLFNWFSLRNEVYLTFGNKFIEGLLSAMTGAS